MSDIKPVQFSAVSPYLYYEDAAAALTWLSDTFGFQEQVRYVDADGQVQEAEMSIGDTVIQLCGYPGYWASQQVSGPVGHLCIVYVDDVDAHWERVSAAGVVVDPPQDRPYGARVYGVKDIGGHDWSFWQRISGTVQLEDGWREIRPGPAAQKQ